MNICFLYPGQGAQYPGMGRDFYEKSASVRQLFALATNACGIDTAELMFESDDSVLKETRNTQIAVTLMDLSVRAYLLEHGIVSTGCGGFSLGEWSAYVDAGVLLPEEVFPIVMKRAALMSENSEKLNSPLGGNSGRGSGMAAVIGLPPDRVEKAIAEIEGVFPVNYNSREQTVISGLADAVELAGGACKNAGARRVIPLKVSGPFHTPLLKDAKEAFDAYLASWELRPPRKELFSNVTGRAVKDVSEVRLNAVKQIDSPVRWTSEEEAIASRGFELCVECGPGKVLSGLWKKAGSEIPCRPTGTLEAADALIEQLHEREEKEK